MKKVTKWIGRLSITVLILLSFGLIFNQQIKNWLVSSYNPTVTRQSIQVAKKQPASFNFSKVKALDWQTVARARASKTKIKVIGEIAYPAVKIHLPIGNGVDNYTLALAAGTLKANQVMGKGNYALAGHHMVDNKVLFSPLYVKAKVGQKVYLTDLKRVYEYTVSQRTFIKATDVQVVNDVPKQRLLTLITCDATGAGRLMIQARYNRSMSAGKAPEQVQKIFSGKFNQQ